MYGVKRFSRTVRCIDFFSSETFFLIDILYQLRFFACITDHKSWSNEQWFIWAMTHLRGYSADKRFFWERGKITDLWRTWLITLIHRFTVLSTYTVEKETLLCSLFLINPLSYEHTVATYIVKVMQSCLPQVFNNAFNVLSQLYCVV